MWRPGFDYARAEPAKLIGYHRAFCVRSTHYRGSEEWPGLVLGLDRGGACHGRLYEIHAENAKKAADYLHEREMITGIYEPRWVKTQTRGGEKIVALTYIVDRAHRQYTGKLSLDAIAHQIGKAVGIAGSNLDYLKNTLCHMREMQIHDPHLEKLGALLEKPNADA